MSGKDLPNLMNWTENNCGFDFTKITPKQDDMQIHAPTINHAFLEALGE